MLHIVKTQQAYQSALGYSLNTDVILLIEDAVYVSNPGHHLFRPLNERHQNVFVLHDDLKARGIDRMVDESIEKVDYVQFVELTELHPSSITWE